MTDYAAFLDSKRSIVHSQGIHVDDSDINPILYPFQRTLVKWSLRKGRCAIFADCGLGKTAMALEWARILGKRTLILAPLSVARQTVYEPKKLGLDCEVHYTRNGNDLIDTINITNYDMIDHFDPSLFGAVIADESSLLKSIDGKTKAKLIEMFANTPYRLCCTATPAPNDITEIANHAEFLGITTRQEMLAMFFVHDDQGWRLKKHAKEPFYRWLASWGMSVRKPSDLNYSDDGYILPPLSIKPIFVETDYKPDGMLFWMGLKGIGDRSRVRKATAEERIACAIELIKGNQ